MVWRPGDTLERPSPADSGGQQGWADESGSPLKELAWGLWARRASIVIVMSMVAGGVLLLSSRGSLSYKASAEVLLKPVSLDAGQSSLPFKTLEPERRVASSAEVARLADRRIGPASQVVSISVAAPVESDTLVFSASAPSAEVAERGARAYSETYLAFRKQDVLEEASDRLATVDRRIGEIDAEIGPAQQELLTASTDGQRATLQLHLTSLFGQRAVLEERRNGMVVPESVEVGRILRPAALPDAPTSPNRFRAGALAVFLGTATAVGQALLGMRMDPRLRGRRDLAVGSGAPVLGLIPTRRPPRFRRVRHSDCLVTVIDPASRQAEAYRSLRATFLFAAHQHGNRSVVVTAANPGDGATTTAANLAVALAQAGRRVVLVAADAHDASQAEIFPPECADRLSDVLSGRQSALGALSGTAYSRLRVLHSGPSDVFLPELLTSEATRAALSEMQSDCDFVLIDAPSVLGAADTLAIAPLVDGVLLVASAEQTTWGSLNEAVLRLDQVGAQILGGVLTRVEQGLVRFDQRGGQRPRVRQPIATGTGWSA